MSTLTYQPASKEIEMSRLVCFEAFILTINTQARFYNALNTQQLVIALGAASSYSWILKLASFRHCT